MLWNPAATTVDLDCCFLHGERERERAREREREKGKETRSEQQNNGDDRTMEMQNTKCLFLWKPPPPADESESLSVIWFHGTHEAVNLVPCRERCPLETAKKYCFSHGAVLAPFLFLFFPTGPSFSDCCVARRGAGRRLGLMSALPINNKNITRQLHPVHCSTVVRGVVKSPNWARMEG
jgi:hypothetical protein